MPEGPEIHREADKIREVLAQQSCSYVYFYHDHLKSFEKELIGKTIESVDAYGKGLVIGFKGDINFYSHNQLYGKWYIKTAGEYPKTNRQLRAELQTDQISALLYSASEIDVMDGESLKEHPYLVKLGPDILRTITPEEIAERTISKKFSGRSFAALLLDQHFLSGVGNYLRSEILFDAGIHPSNCPKDLTEEQVERFSKSVLQIAHRAYETGGITLDEKRVRELKRNGEKRRGYRHYVFARADKNCRSCGNTVKKISMSGRRLYLCEHCQK